MSMDIKDLYRTGAEEIILLKYEDKGQLCPVPPQPPERDYRAVFQHLFVYAIRVSVGSHMFSLHGLPHIMFHWHDASAFSCQKRPWTTFSKLPGSNCQSFCCSLDVHVRAHLAVFHVAFSR